MIGGVLSGYIVLEAARARVPLPMLVRMLANVGIDTLVGVVPVFGDLFDAAWKANVKNVVLLQGHLVTSDEVSTQRRSVVGATTIALGVLALIVIGGIAGAIFLGRLLWELSTQ